MTNPEQVRLVALGEGPAERFRVFARAVQENDNPKLRAVLDLLAADDLRSLADSYEAGITVEEAKESADWIRGHRPASEDATATGRSLDQAVRKLRRFTQQGEPG